MALLARGQSRSHFCTSIKAGLSTRKHFGVVPSCLLPPEARLLHRHLLSLSSLELATVFY